MKFRIKTNLYYDVYAPTTFIFNVQALSNSEYQKVISESLEIIPNLVFREFALSESNTRFIALKANEFIPFSVSYQATVEVQFKTIPQESLLKNTPIFNLKDEIMQYLNPSRHCPSDKLMKIAVKLFGHLPTDFEKAKAINDWIFNNIDYVAGSTNASTTAYDTLNQREGVCKDFAHLGIALCRALNIPARYFTCYAINLNPPDIHACFEVYLGNEWIVFDPTRLAALNGLVKISHGQDGSQVAVANLFGNAFCTYMHIECEIIENSFYPIYVAQDFFISY